MIEEDTKTWAWKAIAVLAANEVTTMFGANVAAELDGEEVEFVLDGVATDKASIEEVLAALKSQKIKRVISVTYLDADMLESLDGID